jgi:acetoin utilization deacetylase AcuC-like enzyme
MKVLFHEDFYKVYTSDPASDAGRIEAVINVIRTTVEFVEAELASEKEIAAVHTQPHIDSVKREGIYSIAALAAGGATQAARIGLKEPAFGLIRPPGHHASSGNAWGFCYFNNIAIALTALKNEGLIKKAFVLDFDLHFGDGTANILGGSDWVTVYNPSSRSRENYVREVKETLTGIKVDTIGISAGFDHHVDDWGGLLATEDYQTIGNIVLNAAKSCGGGCFAILEGGYNHDVLGVNVKALLDGLSEK